MQHKQLICQIASSACPNILCWNADVYEELIECESIERSRELDLLFLLKKIILSETNSINFKINISKRLEHPKLMTIQGFFLIIESQYPIEEKPLNKIRDICRETFFIIMSNQMSFDFELETPDRIQNNSKILMSQESQTTLEYFKRLHSKKKQASPIQINLVNSAPFELSSIKPPNAKSAENETLNFNSTKPIGFHLSKQIIYLEDSEGLEFEVAIGDSNEFLHLLELIRPKFELSDVQVLKIKNTLNSIAKYRFLSFGQIIPAKDSSEELLLI
jgi:hypothetical protein